MFGEFDTGIPKMCIRDSAYPVGDCVMTKSAPILKLDDIKGKKLGFEGGGLRFETMQALGASVVGMNMSDLYQAMQGGIIDGIVMDFDPLISRRYGCLLYTSQPDAEAVYVAGPTFGGGPGGRRSAN